MHWIRQRRALFTVGFAMTFALQPFEYGMADGPRVGVAGYDRPGRDPHASRSVTVARHGIVATSQPLAAQVGLDVLKRGGNAADAAIATCAMLGVVEPMSGGIGGDLFAIYWDSKTQKLYGLNGSGRSPYAISRDVFKKRGLQSIPETGILSWSIPGCVGGWETLHQRFGTAEWKSLLAPAIETAEDGFAVTEVIARYWAGSEKGLKKHADSAATFLVTGQAPRFGEVFRNPNLASSLRSIAEEGGRAFYEGTIARQIVEFSEKNGGLFSLRDFSDHQTDWVEPVSTNYRGYDVWELPPNGQGIAALEMLNLLEPHDLRALGAGSPEYLHLLIEAKRLAFADRAKYYADPSFGRLPVAELISKEYAARRGQLIDPQKAASDLPAGDPKLAHGDTFYLTVVDKDRNCCSMIQSNYFGFGSQIVPGEVGFVIQNRGALFSLDEGHLNRLEPHKRPFHTIIPAMVTKEERPWFCFGVMGGAMQPQGHVQVLVNMIDFGMNAQQAGDAARIRHTGSPQPTGDEGAGSGTVHVESGIGDEAIARLRALGHRVVRGQTSVGGYQGILIDWENHCLHGGTEPRKDGAAVGY